MNKEIQIQIDRLKMVERETRVIDSFSTRTIKEICGQIALALGDGCGENGDVRVYVDPNLNRCMYRVDMSFERYSAGHSIASRLTFPEVVSLICSCPASATYAQCDAPVYDDTDALQILLSDCKK